MVLSFSVLEEWSTAQNAGKAVTLIAQVKGHVKNVQLAAHVWIQQIVSTLVSS